VEGAVAGAADEVELQRLLPPKVRPQLTLKLSKCFRI